MHRLRITIAGAALLATAACSERAKSPATDSALARDLALAGSQATQPTFQDTAIAPTPVLAGTSSRQPAPAPRAALPPLSRTPQPIAQAPAPQAAAAPAVQPSAPAAVPAAAPAAAPAEIGAGARFALTSGSKVCSSSLPGEKFVATVNSAVTGSNGAVIPAGSTVVLEVASATPGQNAESAHLTFRVRAVVIGDKTYSASAEVTPEAELVKSKVQSVDPNSDRNKVIGGAIAGALIGRMIGHSTKGTVIGAATGAAAGAAAAKAGEKWEACLPAGSPLRMTLSSSLLIS